MKFLFLSLVSLAVWAQEPMAPAPESTAPFRTLFLLGEVNLIGFDWKDIALEREAQFVSPLLKSWEKWLKERGIKSVGEVRICESECLAFHKVWEEKTPEELTATPDPLYENTLWLKVSLNLRRGVKNNSQKFSWEGRVLLVDGNTKRSFANMALPREEKEWLWQKQNEINTGLVSRVYKTPLGAFPSLIQKAESALPLNRVIRLVIKGHRNVGDVARLMEVLQTRGTSLGLQMELGQFNPQEAVMKGYFRGEEKSFTDLLSQVKELKSSYNYSLVNEVSDSGLVIRMVKQ